MISNIKARDKGYELNGIGIICDAITDGAEVLHVAEDLVSAGIRVEGCGSLYRTCAMSDVAFRTCTIIPDAECSAARTHRLERRYQSQVQMNIETPTPKRVAPSELGRRRRRAREI